MKDKESDNNLSSCPLPEVIVTREAARKLLLLGKPNSTFPENFTISVDRPDTFATLEARLEEAGTSLQKIKSDGSGIFKSTMGGSGRSSIVLNRSELESRAGISYEEITKQHDSASHGVKPRSSTHKR